MDYMLRVQEHGRSLLPVTASLGSLGTWTYLFFLAFLVLVNALPAHRITHVAALSALVVDAAHAIFLV